MSKEAKNVFESIKTKDAITIGASLVEFNSYLNSLIEKKLSDNMFYDWVFKTDFNTHNERQVDCYVKTNIQAAAKSLERVIKFCHETDLTDFHFRLLSDFVCDLKPFVLKLDKGHDYSWLLLNTNSHITNFYQDLSFNSFWHGRPGNHFEENLVLASSTPFIIRQTIEYKIMRILGINYYLVNDKPDIQFISKLFSLIENIKTNFSTKIDFDFLKKMHKWSSKYIQGGYRPYPWQTETALNYLQDLFYSGQTSNSQSYSLYAGVEVKKENLQEFKLNIEKTLKGLCKPDDELKIYWRDKPEVAIV